MQSKHNDAKDRWYNVESFLRSISLASLITSLSIFGWSDLLQILLKPAAFSFAFLWINVFRLPNTFVFSDPICCSFLTWFGHHHFSARQFCLSAVSYRGSDMIFWIFVVVHCHGSCVWHWPICKHLDLSFVWGHHHLHLVGMNDQSISSVITSLLATPCWQTNKVETAVHGCNSWLSVWILSCRCHVKLST